VSANLAEPIGPTLPGGSRLVVRVPDPRVAGRLQRREQRLAVLRIEVTVDPDHPVERGRDVEVPPPEALLVRSLRGSMIDGGPPMVHCLAQLAHPERARRVHQQVLGIRERFGVRGTGLNQRSERCSTDVSRSERRTNPGHGPKRSRAANIHVRGRPREPEPRDQPRDDRQVPIAGERATPLDLGDPAERLRVQEVGRSDHLVQVGLQPVVVDTVEVVDSELLYGGTERAHVDHAIERTFDGL
jgi:hypothetical protein